MYSIFPDANLHLLARDMTQELELRSLNGIIAANSLHYVERRRQSSVLRNWRRMLRSDGRLIIVEYDADDGNRWVPFPFSCGCSVSWLRRRDSPPELLADMLRTS